MMEMRVYFPAVKKHMDTPPEFNAYTVVTEAAS